jgi:hypothetical protein
VTNVVAALGEAHDSASVLHTALDSLRTAFKEQARMAGTPQL